MSRRREVASGGSAQGLRKRLRDQAERHAHAKVNLASLRQQWKGAEYRLLVQKHVRKTGAALCAAVGAAILPFNEIEQPVAEVMIDEYNLKGYDASFWRRDCADVLDEITRVFRERMQARGVIAEEWLQFNMFQAITVNFAQMAFEQKGLRQFIGIRKSFFFR